LSIFCYGWYDAEKPGESQATFQKGLDKLEEAAKM
jgi:hypothetical protein